MILDFTYRCLLDSREHTGGFHNVLGACFRPWNRLRVTLTENGDLVSVDNKLTVLGLDLTLEFAMGGVILEHVDHVIETDEGIIDGHDLDEKISRLAR